MHCAFPARRGLRLFATCVTARCCRSSIPFNFAAHYYVAATRLEDRAPAASTTQDTHAICADAGISLRVLQAISGHSNLDVLSWYLQTSDIQKRDATNAFG